MIRKEHVNKAIGEGGANIWSLVKDAADDEKHSLVKAIRMLASKEGRASLITSHGAQYEIAPSSDPPATHASNDEYASDNDGPHQVAPPRPNAAYLAYLQEKTKNKNKNKI